MTAPREIVLYPYKSFYVRIHETPRLTVRQVIARKDGSQIAMTSARTEELVKYDREHILHAQIPLGETLGVIYDSAEGIVLRDTEGKEYLDASSQMVSANLGHGRREIIDAVKAQLDQLQHVGQYYGHSSTPMVECAQKLATVTPGDLDHFWFTSGGGESTDAAIRLVRRYFTAPGASPPSAR